MRKEGEIRCVYCGGVMRRVDPKGAFLICDGGPGEKHKDYPYLVSLKFSSNGQIPKREGIRRGEKA